MKTISINLYEFKELNKESQKKAVNNLQDINVNYNWWESTYEDSERIGLKLNTFDLDRNKHAKGEFINSGYDCANLIIKEHGKDCQTYKTAEKYLKEYKLLESNTINKNGGVDTTYFDDENLEDINDKFLEELLNDYANILQDEYYYLTSEEAIIDGILSNEYTFEANGKLNNG